MRRIDEQKATPLLPERGWRAGQPTIRKTSATFWDGGKERRIIVALYPSGRIGLRLEGLREEESVTAGWCYEQAAKARVASELADKPRRKRRE